MPLLDDLRQRLVDLLGHLLRVVLDHARPRPVHEGVGRGVSPELGRDHVHVLDGLRGQFTRRGSLRVCPGRLSLVEGWESVTQRPRTGSLALFLG